MTHVCPVCFYPALEDPVEPDEICPSCGTHFGYDDFRRSHAELRNRWIRNGANWWSRYETEPPKWRATKRSMTASLSAGKQLDVQSANTFVTSSGGGLDTRFGAVFVPHRRGMFDKNIIRINVLPWIVNNSAETRAEDEYA
jgi:hypothetical protein